jgi:ribosomal protein S18 acetylase RimI-like enzyme
MADALQVTVRPRRDSDVPDVVTALRLVHDADRYPLSWPEDPAGWLRPSRQRRAFVAVVVGGGTATIAGHVALNTAAGDPAVGVATSATGLPVDHLAVVARAFVVPGYRRRGIGSSLLAAAIASARSEGLSAVLDVLESDRAAIALYEQLGWQRIGWVMLRSRQGEHLPSYVYRSPDWFGPSATPATAPGLRVAAESPEIESSR